MNGSIDVFIPRTANGERLTGLLPKGQRARAVRTRATDVRTYFDPLADRNLSNAIMTSPKVKPFDPRVAPRGWSLRRIETPLPTDAEEAPVPLEVDVDVEAAVATPSSDLPVATGALEHCGKRFRRAGNGLAWHMANVHGGVAACA